MNPGRQVFLVDPFIRVDLVKMVMAKDYNGMAVSRERNDKELTRNPEEQEKEKRVVAEVGGVVLHRPCGSL